jgi:hypothetical protein
MAPFTTLLFFLLSSLRFLLSPQPSTIHGPTYGFASPFPMAPLGFGFLNIVKDSLSSVVLNSNSLNSNIPDT